MKKIRSSNLWLSLQKRDKAIYFSILILMLFGMIAIISASMGIVAGNTFKLMVIAFKQLMFLIVGYISMISLEKIFRLSFLKTKAFNILIWIMIISLIIPLFFHSAGGAKAWIRFPFGLTLQPSEFAKIMVILITARFLGDNHKHYSSTFNMVVRPFCYIASMVFIVFILQNDLGSALVLFLIFAVIFLLPRHRQLRKLQTFFKLSFWFGVVGGGYFLLYTKMGEKIISALMSGYKKARFTTMFNPFHDPYGFGYQLINGLISFSVGSWFGCGIGQSIRKYTDFPAANTDFIVAVVVEEVGFIGFLFLMLLYGIIIFRLFNYAIKIKLEKAKIILIGTAMYLLIHMFFNIGGATGFIPLTGVPLLMISAGGSSTWSFMISIGIAQAVIGQYKRGEIQ